jgi:hypothetical protein
MVYSTGAFLDPGEPLETAHQRKLDLICRKLQLQPGQQLERHPQDFDTVVAGGVDRQGAPPASDVEEAAHRSNWPPRSRLMPV